MKLEKLVMEVDLYAIVAILQQQKFRTGVFKFHGHIFFFVCLV